MPSPIPRKSQDPRAQFDKACKFKINMNVWLCCIIYYFSDMACIISIETKIQNYLTSLVAEI